MFSFEKSGSRNLKLIGIINDSENIDLNDELTTDQHLELEDLLQQTLYKFLKQHNLHERVWTVFDSKEYRPEDYGISRMDYDYSQE